jgi:hypothetical protein
LIFLAPTEDLPPEPLLPTHSELGTPHVDSVWDDDKKRKRTNEVCRPSAFLSLSSLKSLLGKLLGQFCRRD